jgi:signal transduction histidine kinase
MSRLSLRLRVTLALAAAAAIALGVFAYVQLAGALDDTIDQNLRARAADLAPLVQRGDPVPAGNDEAFAAVGGAPLSAADRARALRGPILLDGRHGEDPARLLAMPVDGRILVVGTAVDDRADALRVLAVALLIAVAIACLVGYAVASARLRAALERERVFVADAGHELRTPLAILRAELELAQRPGRTREELMDAVRSAAEEADRLSALAEDLLVIARADDGQLPLRPATLRAGEVLRAVAARFPGRAAAAGEDVELRADPDRLQQALGNLVDNALRHGGTHVELAAERVDGSVELHVRDDGPGFPPELLDAAFDRFTRGARGGSGLGLAIVDLIARAHGGEAGALNRPGGGADVWISLPCAS